MVSESVDKVIENSIIEYDGSVSLDKDSVENSFERLISMGELIGFLI